MQPMFGNTFRSRLLRVGVFWVVCCSTLDVHFRACVCFGLLVVTVVVAAVGVDDVAMLLSFLFACLCCLRVF